jgi:phospholipase/carboxylesterase
MNRLHLLETPFLKALLPSSQHPRNPPSLSVRTEYALFIPLHYEPNYAYPLLIWLHGPDGNERQLKLVMPHISVRNYVGVSPRGAAAEEIRGAFTWRQSAHDVTRAIEDILECIELARRKFHIADTRVYLAGYDSGGTMALRVGLLQPDRFAGVISIGGPLPKEDTPLVHLQRARRLPVLLAHGRDSGTYATDDVCRDLRLLYAAGMSVTLRQYPCGQEVTTQMLSDVDAWIMERVTGSSGARCHDGAQHIADWN